MKCLIDGCNNNSKTKGLCGKHYQRLLRHGDVNYTEKIYDHPDTCSVDGCKNIYFTMGFCNKHYLRFKKYGDPLFTKTTHEEHGLRSKPEYEVWAGMKARCNNPTHVGYKRYGGKGISVCKRWSDSFLSFYTDVGPRPSKTHQIDRIDSLGNYEPGNCRWATVEENNQNRNTTKLSPDIVCKIRDEYKKGENTHKGLSQKYGVTRSVITAIINNKKWKNA